MKSKTIRYGVLLLLFLLTGSWLLPGSALADYRQYYGWGPGMMGWGGTMGWFGPLGMILFWVVIILVIVLLVRGIRTSKANGREAGPAETALEILKKRYARGEINKEEYLERKKDLE
jgi:putative membrane protein